MRAVTSATPDRRTVVTAAVSGMALLIVGATSLVYLSAAYREAAPYRAEQARLVQERRLAADRAAAERERQLAEPIPGQTLEVSVPDVGREQIGQPSRATPGPDRSSGWMPLEWAVPPRYSVRPDQLRGDFERVSSRLTCVAAPDGRLSQCRGVDTPAGSGLSAILAPQLAEARVVPSRVDGRNVATNISLTVSFEIERREVPRPPSPSVDLPSSRNTPFSPTVKAEESEMLLPSVIPEVPSATTSEPREGSF